MCTTRSISQSDHKLFRGKFKLRSAVFKRGRGYYKMNTLLLSEPGVDDFVLPRLGNLLVSKKIFLDWECFKNELKEYFLRLGKCKAKQRYQKRQSIETSIRKTYKLMEEYPDEATRLKAYIKHLKEELEAQNNFYISSCRHTTYYKDFVGDIISFSSAKSLQRKDWEQRHIHSIQKSDGSMVSAPNEILQELRDQYILLFKSEEVSQHAFEHLLRDMNLPKLTEEQKVRTDELITEKEVSDAIHAIQGAKTPGFDGIPIEFYWKYSEKLSLILCRLFNMCIANGLLPDSCYDGVISLLYKIGRAHV